MALKIRRDLPTETSMLIAAAVSLLTFSKSSSAPTTSKMNTHTTQTRVFDPLGNETGFALHVSLSAEDPLAFAR